MTINTPNLNLHKKDPLTDGNDYFDVKTMLNDNWDRIDGNAKVIDDRLKKVEEPTRSGTVASTDKVNYHSDAVFGKYDISLHGNTISNLVLKGNVETSLTSDASGTRIDINNDGTWEFLNAYSASNQLFNIVSGNKYFVYYKLKDTSIGGISSITLVYSDNTSQTLHLSSSSESYGIITANSSMLANITVHEGLAGNIDRDYQLFIPMDDLGIEHYSETQMLEIARKGYFNVRSAFEGLDEGLESVSENLLDSTKVTRGTVVANGFFTNDINSPYGYTDFIPVISGQSYTKQFGYNCVLYDSNKAFVELLPYSTTVVTNISGYVVFNFDWVNKDTTYFVLGTTAPASYTKHYLQTLEIGKALQAVGIAGGLKRVGSAHDEVKEGKLYKRTEKYILHSTDIDSIVTSTPNVDYVRILKPVDYIGYNKSTEDNSAYLGTYTEKQYADDVSNEWSFDVGANLTKIILVVPKGTYTDLESAQTELSGTTLTYQLAQELDPMDLNLPTLNSFYKGTLIQSSKVPGELIYNYPTNLGQTLKDVKDQLQDYEERLTVLDKYGSKSLSLDYKSPVEYIQANMSDTPTIVVTGNKLVPNRILNSNFESGISNWTGNNATLSASNNILYIEGNGGNLTVQGFQTTEVPHDLGRKIFARAKCKVTNSSCTRIALVIANDVYENGIEVASVNSPVSGTEYDLYGIKTVTLAAEKTSIFLRHTYINAATANGKAMEVQEVFALDLNEAGLKSKTADELNEMFPFYTSVQPLRNPTVEVVNGDNLTTGEVEEGTINTTTGIRTDSTNQTRNKESIVVEPNTKYSIDNESGLNNLFIFQYDKDRKYINSSERNASGGNKTFTTHADCKYIDYLYTSTYVSDAKIIFNKGKALPYMPFKGKGTVIFPTELCSENDKITWNGGSTATVESEWKKVVLDGSLDWSFVIDSVGYKHVRIPDLVSTTVTLLDDSAIVSKYDGKILENVGGSGNITSADQNARYNTEIRIALADTDTGWGETYTPTTDEIKAYFMGWKMYDANTNPDGSGTFNTGGNKHWARRVGGIGGSYTSATNILPTTLANEFNPYQLFYQLATKEVEEIDVHIVGQAPIITEESNTIIVDSGLVYEKANPKLYSINNQWYINFNTAIDNLDEANTKYKNSSILKIYKVTNGLTIDDTKNWEFLSTLTPWGKERVTIKSNLYDQTSQYYILYKALNEEYNNQQVKVTLIMEDNLRDSHENLERVVADNTKEIAQTKQELIDSYLKGESERVEAGTVAISATSSTTASATVIFKKGFANPPIVTATSGDSYRHATTSIVTTTQAVIYLRHINDLTWTGTVNVNWIAIGE